MTSGFETIKDILDVVGIPVALALLAIAWPPIQSLYRCRRFRLLAIRELQESGPFPGKCKQRGTWTEHLKKEFLHQKIIEDVSENRDFILGLNPEFTYSLSQLWSSYKTGNATQWLWYLTKLAQHRYLRKERAKLLSIRQDWDRLIGSYLSTSDSSH